MREEEKLARDVYLALSESFTQPVFANIARSEETHMSAVLALMERYGIADPAAGKARGEFTDPAFAELYTQLVTRGKTSLLEAAKVGAEIEELDIADLRTRAARTDQSDILALYNELERGSRNHLRAFTRQIVREGGTFTATHLSQADADTIISSPQEGGMMGGRGGGMMRGGGDRGGSRSEDRRGWRQ
jgi:hypothetical protein